MKIIRTLLTAVIFNKNQEIFTKQAYQSLESKEHVLDVYLDTKRYQYALAEAWNNFFNYWHDKDYDYLVIACNDAIAKPYAMDYMVRCLEESGVDILCAKWNKDWTNFTSNEVEYSPEVIEGGDSANWICKKGVIEKIGLADIVFPHEFIERDYFRRAELLGLKVRCTKNAWFYHGHEPISTETRTGIGKALAKYTEKWGGDFTKEQYIYPYDRKDIKLEIPYED